MRDRRVRAAFVGLILVFPLLLAATAPRRQGASLRSGLTLLGVEAVLAVGLVTVARERRLLLAERASMAVSVATITPVRSSRRNAAVRASTR